MEGDRKDRDGVGGKAAGHGPVTGGRPFFSRTESNLLGQPVACSSLRVILIDEAAAGAELEGSSSPRAPRPRLMTIYCRPAPLRGGGAASRSFRARSGGPTPRRG
ncbi:hypothetical protein NDU88_001951 [Pleurodeles waltl]|uniref:Uncharacterized protein n=1 Tax=Pleurodeles waltl TaxID=8319 RepID=A0AAV7Q8J0_PLEWA|nr:hypothetical protein NDU88_001951 [Pleurodeles waltl]